MLQSSYASCRRLLPELRCGATAAAWLLAIVWVSGCEREPPEAAEALAASIISTATATTATSEVVDETADQIGQLARVSPVTQVAVDALIVAAHSPNSDIRRASLNRFMPLVRLGADKELVMQLRAAALGALRSEDESVRIAAMNFFFDAGIFQTDPVIVQVIEWHEKNDPSDANQRRARGELQRLERRPE